ncbi:MAG: hypothetical protein GY759_03985, partial [Chloroflexi bacterium]|nr:hypothetical protein [Chloroflexota bacterium]
MTESELAALEETNPEEFKNLSNLAKEGLIIIDPDPIESEPSMSSDLDVDLIEVVDDEAALDGVVDASAAAEVGSSTSAWATAGSVILQVLITAILIGVVWMNYASQAKSLQGIQKDIALSQAIASTIILGILLIIGVVLAIFATTVVGAVIEVAILVILYLLVAIITGDWNPLKTYSYLTDWLSEWLLKVELLAEVGADSVASSPMQLTMDPDSTRTNGPMPGNLFQISLTLSTTLSMNPDLPKVHGWTNARAGNANDVKASWGYARWEQISDPPSYLHPPGGYYDVTRDPLSFGKGSDAGLANCDSSLSDDNTKSCYSDNRMTFKSAKAGRNTGIPYLASMETYLKYEKCWWDYIGYSCSTDMNYTDSTDDSSTQAETLAYFYIDIIPDNLDTLFTWNVHNPISNTNYADFNVDQDNDDLS